MNKGGTEQAAFFIGYWRYTNRDMLIYKSNTEKQIFEIINSQIEHLGYKLVKVRFDKNNKKRATLQLVVDKEEGGINITDCEFISRNIAPVIEADDPIKVAYNLEVSSPGINRPLTRFVDFQHNVGKKVSVHTMYSIEGRKNFTGLLQGVLENSIVIRLDDNEQSISIDLNLINEAHLKII